MRHWVLGNMQSCTHILAAVWTLFLSWEPHEAITDSLCQSSAASGFAVSSLCDISRNAISEHFQILHATRFLQIAVSPCQGDAWTVWMAIHVHVHGKTTGAHTIRRWTLPTTANFQQTNCFYIYVGKIRWASWITLFWVAYR
jgi:hypothetical protein